MDCQEAVIERNGMQGIQLPVFRAIYVSSLRNRLLAEAFYLTGDIERYGTGFVRAREILQTYPEIVLRVEEMGDFFKVELQQVAQVTPPNHLPNIPRNPSPNHPSNLRRRPYPYPGD